MTDATDALEVIELDSATWRPINPDGMYPVCNHCGERDCEHKSDCPIAIVRAALERAEKVGAALRALLAGYPPSWQGVWAKARRALGDEGGTDD